MPTKRTVLGILVVAMFLTPPNLPYAQGVWLRSDDGTDGCGYFPEEYLYWGYMWATKLSPSYDQFQVDSIGFYVYRYSQPTPATERLTFRVRLFEDDGIIYSDDCPDGDIDCEGLGTCVYSTAVLQTPTLPTDVPLLAYGRCAHLHDGRRFHCCH